MTDVLRDNASRGLRGRVEERLGRGNRTPLGLWFWEIDRVLLLLAFLLIAIGLVAVAAASPASAIRYSDGEKTFPAMYYFWRQAMWVTVSIPFMLGTSMLSTTAARRIALVGTLVLIVALMALPFVGAEVNGARRWIGLGFTQFQPSEFLKPLFIVTTAWLLSLRAKDPELPLVIITGGLTALVGGLLMLQPDFGQTVVFGAVWMVMLMIAGTSPKAIGALIGSAVAGIVAAYFFYGTARTRIDAFLFPDPDKAMTDHYQTDMAHATITGGGITGTGPGGGIVKFKLPEAHTDYIFSVVGEEFGLMACAAIALVFLAIVVRVFVKLLDEEDAFRLLAASGLAVQLGIQALINMAVNTGIAPSKGMTLPFISYGGSSMIALSIGFGLLLAFTRRNPYLKRSPYSVARSKQ
ncbi:putative lipid II flippase FtsW [Sphingomonas sp. S1-29]|uniref:Probable peptidoglycan glycosyltransferase FtsW n=1 Tax=Sphingomonas qomolangmaensis TaxID=2918765 RepID=A0ABY5L760_9SPHN|nr:MULTISPECIES: putative peptidoglycan glycosyltransferase FtsW [Sphingomonas]UUL82795.1 putative lipid II flippase FtsW [Sphingomonas qomolangmaensis]UZK69277.1 putative lipid II flippase FtsW [Sphingomonas sp. S1-29]